MKKKIGEMYAKGFLCACGKVYPAETPYPPFIPAPDVCPRCGMPKEKMDARSVLIEKYVEGWWVFKSKYYKYLPGNKF